MRIAVTGTSGRVGAALALHFSAAHEVICLPRKIFDLADPRAMSAVLGRLDCDVMLNPAGITSLEACEDDRALAMRVNAEAPAEMEHWARQTATRLVHFSTDYVFDGIHPCLKHETDSPHPLSVYGTSKLAGERAVLAGPAALVVRVSWVFGPEKPSFVDQIYAAALAGNNLSAIADKFSLPTATADLGPAVAALLAHDCHGLYHFCQSGDPTSWHGMARIIVDEMVESGKISVAPEIEALTLAEVSSFRATRPRFTAMDTTKFTRTTAKTPRGWQDAIREYVRSC